MKSSSCTLRRILTKLAKHLRKMIGLLKMLLVNEVSKTFNEVG
jgi:hypothetical protein